MRDLAKWDRETAMTSFSNMFDDLWGRLFTFDDLVPAELSKFTYPKVDVKKTDLFLVMEASVPGLTKDEVTVEHANDTLTIKGNKQGKVEHSNDSYLIKELHKSTFTRSFRVRQRDYDVANIEAQVENGILKITIPTRLPTKVDSVKIEVK